MKQQILWVVEAHANGIEMRRTFVSRARARVEASQLKRASGWATRVVKYIRSE